MNCILKDEIDFSELKQLKPDNKNIYYKGKKVYKFFRWDDYDMHIKEDVLESLNKKQTIENAALPYDKIKAGIETLGCTTELYEDYITLDNYRKTSDNFNDYIRLVRAISSTLKAIHQHDCIVTNFCFQNIMFNKALQHRFISTDSWSVGYYHSSYISSLLNEFLKARDLKFTFNRANTNIDKLSFILAFLEIIFNMPIQSVSRYNYDEVLEKLNLSKETIILLRRVLDENPLRMDLPYIGDCIANSNGSCFYVKK